MVPRKPKRQPELTSRGGLGEPQKCRRRESRSPLSVGLRVCGFSAAGRIFSEVTCAQNISRSGCSLRLRTEPLDQSTLSLQIVPCENPLRITKRLFLYETIWQRQRGDFWDVGLSALDQEDLLRAVFAGGTTLSLRLMG